MMKSDVGPCRRLGQKQRMLFSLVDARPVLNGFHLDIASRCLWEQ